MGISVIIPLIEEHFILHDFSLELTQAAGAYVLQEVIIIIADSGIKPFWLGQVDHRINVIIVRSPKEHGREGALKRGLFAASSDRIVTIEHPDIPLKEILIYDQHSSKDKAILLGVLQQQPQQALFDRCKEWVLVKGLVDGYCAFRCLSREQMLPILGRIYLDRDGFNVEWAYVTSKLGLVSRVIPVNIAADLPSPNLKMFWNLLRIRNWHFPMINTKDEHMSDHDMAEMYAHESHHWWFVAKALFMKKILRRWIPQGQDYLVLDAGCGTGHNMRFLAEEGAYVGVDVSSQALHFCQANGHKTLVQGNLDKLPFKDGSFDVVFALDVIEHTQNPWVVIHQLKRVLKKDSRIIVTVPACRFLFGPHDEALSHLRRYDPKDIRALLKEAGFAVEHVNYLYFFCFFPVAVIRIFRKLLVCDPKPCTDMYYMPAAWINPLLNSLLAIEVLFLCRVPFPIGTTVVAVARKE